jgi:hypothetical protein
VEPFDCELIRAAWPAQPANTISALAFVVIGVWLWRRRVRAPAILTVATGLASVWFHGSPGDAASWAHDVALYGLIAVGAIEVWRRLGAGKPPVLAGAILAAGAAVWFTSRTGGALCDPGATIQGHAVWHVAAAIAVAVLFSRREALG